jgi:TRAP-type C4-dicarboxylate transport system permease small subunit
MDLSSLVRSAIRIFSLVIGVFAVIMLIIAGFRYVTANGDSNSITSAKQSIIYALVGLVVAGAAQAIVQFVLHSVH